MHLDLKHPVVHVVVAVHPASNGNVWKLEERFVVVRRWDLQERRKVWIDRSCKGVNKPIQGHGPYLNACGGFDRERLFLRRTKDAHDDRGGK